MTLKSCTCSHRPRLLIKGAIGLHLPAVPRSPLKYIPSYLQTPLHPSPGHIAKQTPKLQLRHHATPVFYISRIVPIILWHQVFNLQNQTNNAVVSFPLNQTLNCCAFVISWCILVPKLSGCTPPLQAHVTEITHRGCCRMVHARCGRSLVFPEIFPSEEALSKPP